MGKKRLVLSFSLGESSAFMTQWCLKNLQDEYEMVVVVANTGDEREESLIFGDLCDKYFGFNLVWVEAVTNPKWGIGTTARVVTFETASRGGEPFEALIAKHGIPNQGAPFCSKELKEYAIKAYLRDSLGWKPGTYSVAIGYRSDEPSRINWETAKKKKHIYPMVTMCRMDKPRINTYWERMPFRLTIKSYEGNCKACWKMSIRKQLTKAVECPRCFDFFKKMEDKYENFIPIDKKKQDIELPIRFFRDNMSTDDIKELSKLPFVPAKDERNLTNQQTELWDTFLDGNSGCVESCEAFS